jgi:hypothetical protein
MTLSHEQGTGQTQVTLESITTQALVAFVDVLNRGEGDVEHEDGSDAGAPKQWYMTTYQIQPQNNPQTIRATVQGR